MIEQLHGELDRLPALHEMPSVKKVREWYARSALEIQEAPKPADATTERAFAKLLETIYERHAGVLYTMAHGAYELRENYEGAFEDDASIHSFLDSFYTSRIGIRMIIGQYLALREPAHGEDAVGLLSTAVAPARIAEDAALQARHLCERQFGVAPDVKIEGRTDLDFEYVPDHAFYILLELLKNSMRASCEASPEDPPAVRVVVPWISELDFDFVLYDEADNTFHFEGTASRDVFDVLTQHPDYYVAPQRYEKGWGGIPRFVLQGNLSRSMNKCEKSLPRLAYT